jgi:hypothetical protein
VQRATFIDQYPASLTAFEFVDAVLKNVMQNSGMDLSSKRADLLSLVEGANGSRAAVVTRVATHPDLMKSESDSAFVLIQYFTYLLRDPDEDGFHYWAKTIAGKNQNDPTRYSSVTCAFVNSNEYQSRFGILTPHSPDECH